VLGVEGKNRKKKSAADKESRFVNRAAQSRERSRNIRKSPSVEHREIPPNGDLNSAKIVEERGKRG
jgi:hypothetical protein